MCGLCLSINVVQCLTFHSSIGRNPFEVYKDWHVYMCVCVCVCVMILDTQGLLLIKKEPFQTESDHELDLKCVIYWGFYMNFANLFKLVLIC